MLHHHITEPPCDRAPAMNHSGDCEDKNKDAAHSQLVFDGPSDERRHGRVPEGRREIGCRVCGVGVAGQEGEVERDWMRCGFEVWTRYVDSTLEISREFVRKHALRVIWP